MMNLKKALDAIGATQEHNNRERLTAALYVGARLALEGMIGESSYNSAAKKFLQQLDGGVVDPEDRIAAVAPDTAPSF